MLIIPLDFIDHYLLLIITSSFRVHQHYVLVNQRLIPVCLSKRYYARFLLVKGGQISVSLFLVCFLNVIENAFVIFRDGLLDASFEGH